jgi:hypothetical protein
MTLTRQTKVVLSAALCWLAACGGVDNSVTRSISKALTLGPEWKVFELKPPLEVLRGGQKIRLELEDVSDWVRPHGALILRDGSQVEVEAELKDQDGGRHRLVATTLGASIGFGPEKAEESAGFARHRKFTELRVRSTKAIAARSIDWYCWTGK